MPTFILWNLFERAHAPGNFDEWFDEHIPNIITTIHSFNVVFYLVTNIRGKSLHFNLALVVMVIFLMSLTKKQSVAAFLA